MAYIKLGNIGDYFGSTKLGIHLTPGNAQYIEDDTLYSLLQNFLYTGFFILIDKDEFDNIKIDRRSLRGIPLQFVGVNETTIVEPVIDILSEEPTSANTGYRFIVWSNPTNSWADHRNQIATFNGVNWDFTIPKDGWIIPVYSLGISVKYSGTYPSGSWNIDNDRIAELKGQIQELENTAPTTVSNPASVEYVDGLIEDEAGQRKAGDDALLQMIQNLNFPETVGKASSITIDDNGDYFIATNVEMALQELATDLRTTKQGVDQLINAYASLNQLVQQLIATGGTGTAFITQAILFTDVDSINYPHQKGRIPIWALYQFTPDGNTQVVATTVLVSVMAQPYRVTFNDIRFQFPKKYNLVLLIG